MKKTFLIALLLIPFFGFSQTTKPIDGFLGIKFGSSRAIVMAAMKAKGALLNNEQPDPTSIMYHGVNLGHRVAGGFEVSFVDNKACSAQYIFATDVEAKVPDFYNDLVNDLNDIYGMGQSKKTFNDPYQEGDGNLLLGLSAGKIIFQTLWQDSNKNTIFASINTDMNIHLEYQDDVLMDLYLAKQKAKEKSDF